MQKIAFLAVLASAAIFTAVGRPASPCPGTLLTMRCTREYVYNIDIICVLGVLNVNDEHYDSDPVRDDDLEDVP
jgi:hypothetical protein